MQDELTEEQHREDDKVREKLPPSVKLVRSLRVRTGIIQCIAWSPNGQILASGLLDGAIRLWNVETGECLRTLAGHKEAVNSVAFNPKGNILASGSADGNVKLWDVGTGQCLRMHQEGHIVNSIAFDSVGRTLASGGAYVILRDIHHGFLINLK